MPRPRRVDNTEPPEEEVSVPPVTPKETPAVAETPALTDDEHAGYILASRGLESLRLSTFCTGEAVSLRHFLDKLESLFGKP